MRQVSILLALVIVLTGGALGITSWPSQAQVLAPPPPPPGLHVVVSPWVGPKTPWVYYNGDWFYNGVLFYYFGPKYGWAPYYAYPRVYIVRPAHWYGPKWDAWYRRHPVYWKEFKHAYPYWRDHRVDHYYDESFYHRYHHGHGKGWYQGY
uniref:Uncharacterized protein n=1 Tax=Desulfobacca acetoxidans TaxID=60893 RepID=A0A7C3V5S2_9BACT